MRIPLLIVILLGIGIPGATAIAQEYETFYVRAAGMVLDQQNDAELVNLDDAMPGMIGQMLDSDVDFETGAGLSLALGYHLGDSFPLAIELEYAYRRVDLDDGSNPLADNGRISGHTIGVNIQFDKNDVIGPVGFYAGIGVGAIISEFEYRTNSETELNTRSADIDSEDGYWQVYAGVTWTVAPKFQLYTGVRWLDFGTMRDDDFKVDAEMASIEFGLRYFF